MNGQFKSSLLLHNTRGGCFTDSLGFEVRPSSNYPLSANLAASGTLKHSQLCARGAVIQGLTRDRGHVT